MPEDRPSRSFPAQSLTGGRGASTNSNAVAADDRDGRQLLAALQRRDADAFRVFVEENQRSVFALISRIVGRTSGPAVAEELAQETFLRAYRALPNFDPEGPAKLSTWLLTIATRIAIDERRKSSPEPSSDDEEFERTPASTPSPEAEVEADQMRTRIEWAASQLPSDQRAALVLAEFHGFSMEEISRALDIPVATAKTKAFRARERMRVLLAPWRTP